MQEQLGLGFYYIPCGYVDKNIDTFMNLDTTKTFFGVNMPGSYVSQTTLNTRLGFTWMVYFKIHLLFQMFFSSVTFAKSIYWYLRPKDPAFIYSQFAQNLITANSYADLVNTAAVRIYADITLGSTEDSEGQGGLLSVVPVSAGNLGVGFYQNNFNNPLTKIQKL